MTCGQWPRPGREIRSWAGAPAARAPRAARKLRLPWPRRRAELRTSAAIDPAFVCPAVLAPVGFPHHQRIAAGPASPWADLNCSESAARSAPGLEPEVAQAGVIVGTAA